MYFIGITGGVGAGKSEILRYLKQNPRFLVREADEIARSFYIRESRIFNELCTILGEKALDPDGSIDKKKTAEIIFNDEAKKNDVNRLIHPAVRDYVTEDYKKAASSGKYDIYFLEAALLIECGYDKICDELWYIYSEPKVRRERLKKSRGYSDEKTDSIMRNQLPDGEYRRSCTHIIDNSGELKDSYREIDRIISGYSC